MRRVSGHGYTFRVDKHLHSEDFSIEDYYFRAKSSPFGRIRLQGLFSQGEFIPIRNNLLHRDYFLRIKSSPYERIHLQGLFSRGEFISVLKNPSPGMLWEYKSILHGRKSKLKMHGNRKQLPVSAKRPKAISGCMAAGNSIQKAAIAANEITNKVPRTPVSSIFICNMSIMRYD